MKILMVAPWTGGIDIYVNSLNKQISQFGHIVSYQGSIKGESAYNTTTKNWKGVADIYNTVANISSRIDWSSFDIVCFHYGKNDIEMLLPVYLSDQGIKLKRTIYFVHFLSRNLFTQYVPDPPTQAKVENAVANFFDGYVFFGNNPKTFMEHQFHKQFSGIVSFLPETHSQATSNSPQEEEATININNYPELPTIYLPGFPANYKDHELLLASLKYVSSPFKLIFAGYGWRKRIPKDITINNVHIYVLDRYLSPFQYKLVTEKSLFGIFPYKQPKEKDEHFQGSGTLPNFIYSGKASIVFNEGAMPEYVANSGIIVNQNPKDLGVAIDQLLTDNKYRRTLETNARKRRHLFTPKYHAHQCLNYFNTLLDQE